MKTILLISGSSSVGKTRGAINLSQHLGWTHIELDHYLNAIDSPELRLFPKNLENWDLPSQQLCKQLITIGEKAIRYIEPLIVGWQRENKAGIIEGEAIHPRLAESLVQTKSVASIFIIELDSERLYETLAGRSRSFLNLPEKHRQTVVEMNRLYGLWLQEEAEQRHLAWVPSQPWESLMQRILKEVHAKAG